MLVRSTKALNREVPRGQAGGMLGTMTLLLLYGAFIVYLTLIPFDFLLDPGGLERWLHPGGRAALTARWLSDVVGNVVFFVPFGCLGILAGRGTRLLANVNRVTLLGAALSLSVETLQAFTPTRQPALPDVLANTTGTFLGACIAVLAPRIGWVARLGRSITRRGSQPLALASLGAMGLALTKGLVPFDVSLNHITVRRSLRTMQLDPRTDPGTWFGEAHELLFHALLAGLVLRWASGRTRPWVAAAAALGTTLVIALVVEVLQLGLKSRTTATRDVLSCLGGGAAGITLSWSLLWTGGTSTHRKLLVLYTLFAGALTALPLALHPAVDMIKIRLVELVPVYWQHWQTYLAKSTEFFATLLLFVPVGYLGVKSMNHIDPSRALVCVPLVSGAGTYVLGRFHGALSGHGDHGIAALAGALGALVGSALACSQMTILKHTRGGDGTSRKDAEGTPLALVRSA